MDWKQKCVSKILKNFFRQNIASNCVMRATEIEINGKNEINT